MSNAHYQKVIQSIFNDISVSLSKTKDSCIQNSMLLTAYDPFKEVRQRNFFFFKKSATIVAEIYINVQSGGSIGAVTAYSLAKELLVDDGNKKQNEILQESYSKFLVNKGIDRNGVDKLMERGESLHTSKS